MEESCDLKSFGKSLAEVGIDSGTEHAAGHKRFSQLSSFISTEYNHLLENLKKALHFW